MLIMDTIFAKKIFYLIDNYSGLFVKHSPDWKYIAVSDDNIRKIFGFQSPCNIQEFDQLVDVILPDELSVKLRCFICRSPSA